MNCLDWAVAHQTKDLNLLAEAVVHADHIVRACAAANPLVSPDQLRLLSSDSDVVVRRTVAWASACPFDVLVLLTTDPDDRTREEAWGSIDRRGLIGLLGEDG